LKRKTNAKTPRPPRIIRSGFITLSRRRNKDIKDDQDKRTPGFILKILDILVSYSFRPGS
jgi:hypothetical protein